MKMLKQLTGILALLFFVPIAIWQLPFSKWDQQGTQVTAFDEAIAFASEQHEMTDKKVLLFATHSHEAYKPIVQKTFGQTGVYNPQENILKLNQRLADDLKQYGIETDMLNIDIMAEMKKSGLTFSESYDAARLFVQEKLSFDAYDLIIDLHRDAAMHDVTTLKAEENYAKVAFVVGIEHPMYDWNLAYAEQLHAKLQELKPGISRGIIKKGGAGVDGIYNQDLAPQMLLVELGGVDNTEEELLRTLMILSKAISELLNGQQDNEAV